MQQRFERANANNLFLLNSIQASEGESDTKNSTRPSVLEATVLAREVDAGVEETVVEQKRGGPLLTGVCLTGLPFAIIIVCRSGGWERLVASLVNVVDDDEDCDGGGGDRLIVAVVVVDEVADGCGGGLTVVVIAGGKGGEN